MIQIQKLARKYDIVLDKSFVEFCRATVRRLEDDWDIVIGIDGEEGIGKSTLGIWLGYGVDRNFNLNSNIAYLPTYAEMEDKFFALKPKSVFDVDEASKVLYKLRWMDKLQIRINEMYSTERWQNKASELLIPRFFDLNEYFRNHRVKIWIRIIMRGYAVAFVRDDVNMFLTDPWRRRENEKIVNKLMGTRKITEITLGDRIKYARKSKNFFFFFEFPKLPPPVWNEYDGIRMKYKAAARKVIRSSSDLQISVALRLIKEGFNQKKVAEILNVEQSTISRWQTKYKDYFY